MAGFRIWSRLHGKAAKLHGNESSFDIQQPDVGRRVVIDLRFRRADPDFMQGLAKAAQSSRHPAVRLAEERPGVCQLRARALCFTVPGDQRAPAGRREFHYCFGRPVQSEGIPRRVNGTDLVV